MPDVFRGMFNESDPNYPYEESHMIEGGSTDELKLQQSVCDPCSVGVVRCRAVSGLECGLVSDVDFCARVE